ncbi:MAG: T9SS type A sorting domain-containing protein, partial [Bacteroidota bacterium]
NGINVGTNSSSYSYTPANNDQITCLITTPTGCYSPGSANSNVIVMTISPNITPSLSIATNFTTICFGSSSTFNATTNITGATYQWKVNGSSVGTNSSSYTYTPVNSDIVSCVITTPASGCFTTTTATSNVITMTVTPYITPTISISTTSNTVCLSTVVTFTANTNITGGAFQWQVNGVNAGPNSNTYNYIPANGDIITCTITAPAGCYSPVSVTSNSINMAVSSSITPTVTVTGNNAICAGTFTTFTAVTNVTGGTYQWKVNNINVGTNLNTFSYNPANGDVIICIITTPSGGCYTASNATSSPVTISVSPNQTPTISITGNNPICLGTSVTFTATSNIAGPTYQWTVNSTNVGTNANTYSFTPANNDQVSCTITTPAGCFSPTVVTSNIITMTVAPDTLATISISGPTLATVGSNVIVTAVVTNAGSNYLITWKINGVFNSYTSIPSFNFTKSAGPDTVTATVASQNPGCYDTSLVSNQHIVLVDLGLSNTSANYKISVHPNPFNETISVSGLALSDKLCIYDMFGRKVSPEWIATDNNSEQSFLINNLSTGNYILTIRDSHGIYKENILLQKQ